MVEGDILGEEVATTVEGGKNGTVEDDNDLFAVKSRFDPDSLEGILQSRQQPAKDERSNNPTSKRQKKALRTTAGAARVAHKLANPDPMAPASNRLVFDDDGVARPPQIFVEETEEDKQAAKRERARNEYVERERQGLERRDLDDKAVAKEKRQLKRDKRKQRERDEHDEDQNQAMMNGNGSDEDAELPVQERPFDDLADLYSSEDSVEAPLLVETSPPPKEQKGKR